jgi:IS30 family transposase
MQALCEKEDCGREYCKGCSLCFGVCDRYEHEYCDRLAHPPYVCNGCAVRKKCTLEKFDYKASKAQRIYEDTLRDSRSGAALSDAERIRMDKIVSPLIKQGHSPYHICLKNKDDLMISDKTLYKYIAANFFDASNTDLRRKVSMKPRRKKASVKVDRSCRQWRTYEDFTTFLQEDPDVDVVQMDTVIGAKGSGEKVLLTLCFSLSHFMLAFIREANTARSVKLVFDELYQRLGHAAFTEIFPVILTDNGSEFSAPFDIESMEGSILRTRMFYCDPYNSNQKSLCENNHRLIRTVTPKGTSMNGLVQEDVNLMMSHINSYSRKSLGGQTTFEVFARQHKKHRNLLDMLGITPIPTNEIVLTPKLFK